MNLKLLKECFEMNSTLNIIRAVVTVLPGVGVNIETTNAYVIEKIEEKFGTYFKVQEGHDISLRYKLYANVIKHPSYGEDSIRDYFDKYGQNVIIHLGHNEGENRYGKRIKCEASMYILFLYSDTLVKVDYDTKSVYIVNSDEKKLALDVTRIIKDGMIQRLLEKEGWKILHAGFAKYNDKGYLILGETGAGKTTLVLGLCSLGATFVSNDRVFVHSQTGKVLGWPEDISVGIGCINSNKNLREYFQIPEGQMLEEASEKKKLRLNDLNTIFPCNPECTADIIDYIIVPQLVLKGKITNPWTNINEVNMQDLLIKSCLSPHDNEHPHWLELIQLDEQLSEQDNILFQTLDKKGKRFCFRTVDEESFVERDY